jgi:uncharacterized membrane protein YsdA (DUF1294 family)/cold shock CspA family protein
VRGLLDADAEHRGRLVQWNDARGFGFIDDTKVPGRVFVHIKDIAVALRRPAVGDEVDFLLFAGRDGRPAATRVRIVGASPREVSRGTAVRTDAPPRVTVRIVGSMVLATAVIFCVAASRAPTWLFACYLAGGAISFSAYWLDKRAATRGTWRTKESTLHLLDLAFGIAGGLLAQGLFRHKTSKELFGLVSAVLFTLHMAAIGLMLAGYGPSQWLAWLSAG